MININAPFLMIKYPDGREEYYSLSSKSDSTVRIGRLDSNDIVLQPDPQEMVSRNHCYIVKKGNQGFWWVVDEGSTNGTWVIHLGDKQDVRHQGDKGMRLCHKDMILIYSSSETDPFQLTFLDEEEEATKKAPFLTYNLNQEKLFVVTGDNKYTVKLTPLQQKLVNYMAQKNYQNQSQPVLCKHSELIQSIWGDDTNKTNGDVTHLIFRLQKDIAEKYHVKNFLETIRNEGYALEVKLVDT